MRKLNRNDQVLIACFAVFFGMVGLAYASVPLYRIFCQATGYGGTPRITAENGNAVSGQTIEVRFDANVGDSLPWDFGPKQNAMKVRLGQNNVAHYFARNESGQPIVGTARFNVTPDKAGQYFNKIQCFCFDRQELKPGQTADFGVSFFVDPAIAKDPLTKDVTAITLSYTFYPSKDQSTVAASAR